MDLIDMFRYEKEYQSKAAGQPILSAGEAGQTLFVLIEGQADVLLGDEVVESAGPGAIFGEMALVDDLPRSATVIARTDCRLISIDANRFNALIQKTPDFARHVMKVMANRIRNMNERNIAFIEYCLRF